MHDQSDTRSDVEPGTVEPSAGDTVPGSRRLRDAIIATLLTAALLAIGAMSVVTAIVIVPFVPLPFAIFALRHGSLQVAGAAIGLVIVGIIEGITRGGGLSDVVIAVTWFAGFGCLLALAHAAIAPDRRYSKAGTLFPLGVWIGLVAVVIVAALPGGGADGIRDTAARETRAAYAPTLKECRKGGALAGRESYCTELKDQRDMVVDVMHDHAPSVLAGMLALGILGSMLTTHILLALFAPRWKVVPARVPSPAKLNVHWTTPYILIVGLVLVMSATQWATIDSLGGAVGVFLATLGTLLMAGQGLGLAWYGLDRFKARILARVVLFFAAVIAWPIALGVLLSLGIFDMAVSPRTRNSGTIDGRGSDSL